MRYWGLLLIFISPLLTAQETEPLYWALTNNDALEVWNLTASKPPPRVLKQNNLPPTVWAVEQGNAEVLQALVWRGVSLDAVDQHGRNLLFAASALGRVDLYNQILASGADPKQVDDEGNSLVQWAASAPHPEILHTLLRQGLNPETRNSRGITPLMRACAAGQPQAVALLLSWGAAVHDEDYFGTTVRAYAVKGKNAAVLNLIDSALTPWTIGPGDTAPPPSPE